MAKVRLAINGFGRIGRSAFKVAVEHDEIDIVAINDLTDTATLAHLLKYDSNYGTYGHDIDYDDTHIRVDRHEVRVLSEKDPTQLPWRDMNVDVVIESTGIFTEPEKAHMHIEAGAKRVIISAPAKGEAETYVLGVNEEAISSGAEISSNASCTTNSAAPVAALMAEHFGVQKAMMTTIHSYTADQNLQDGPHKDLRRARAAAENIVPTSSGSATDVAKAVPVYKGIFHSMAVRVPTPVVSLTDFTILTEKDTTVEAVNSMFVEASKQSRWSGILAVTDLPLVSGDFIGDSHSSIVDLSLTQVVGGNLVKVIAWYDNEWGFSNRMIELVVKVAATT